MSIIAQTLLTNKTKKDRHVTWAGVALAPGETRVIEGLYPGSCKTPSAIKDMAADVEAGIIGVVLITDLPTMKPEGSKRERPQPVAKKLRGTEPVKLNPKEDTRKALTEVGKKVDSGENAVFQKGRIEDAVPIEMQLKTPDGDDPAAQLRPQSTVFFGGEEPAGMVSDQDPLRSLGEIQKSEITRGAAFMIEKQGLSDKEIAQLTQNGHVKRVTKPMVKNFLKQMGRDVLVDAGDGTSQGEDDGGSEETGQKTDAGGNEDVVKGGQEEVDSDSFD